MQNSDSTRKKVSEGLIWTFGERITAQLVSTIVTIVLARLLDPEHYGIISIVTVFITFCNVFVSTGFGSAVVQRKDADEDDFNTAFIISFVVALSLYAILFFAAPYIQEFYGMESLSAVIRVMALRLPLAALNSIQQSYVQREMAFKRFFVATLLGTVLSGIIGIVLAFTGAGVWALVAQYLTNTTVDTIVLWFVCGWTPRLRFSTKKAKELFGFGWKVLASNLIANLESDIRSLLVGKVFGAADLAFYDQGKKYPALLVNNINSSINKVMLPAYSKNQDDNIHLKSMLRRSIQIGLFILLPLMLGFSAVSHNFVSVILTEKWLTSVPYIQIFCVYFLTRPIETSCQQAVLAKGRSDIVFRIMLLVNCVSLLTVIIAVFMFHDVFMIAIGSLFTTIVSIICYMFFSNKLFGYSVKEQITDIIKPLSISLMMVVIVKSVDLIQIDELYRLILQICLGAISYFVLAFVTRNETFSYLLGMVKKIR